MLHRIKRELGGGIGVTQHYFKPHHRRTWRNDKAGTHDASSEKHLITFREGAGAANVVCVHPAGGTAFCYLSLAKTLAEDIGVYGLQSLGLNDGETACTSVEEMAQHYLGLIRELPTRPLVITGLSFGGLVAHELGRLLAAEGRTDISTVLLDTQGTHDEVARRSIDVVDLEEFREKLVRFNGTYPGIENAQIERYFDVYNQNRLAVRDYAVPPTDARLAISKPSVICHAATCVKAANIGRAVPTLILPSILCAVTIGKCWKQMNWKQSKPSS